MLLQNWQGFTHIDDPIKGSIPQSAFAGHLESSAHKARRTLAKCTIEDVRKITDDVDCWFTDVYPEMDLEDTPLTRTHSQVCQLGSGLFGEEFRGDEYHAVMALMLVNEALRLEGDDATIAIHDAADAAEYAFRFMAKERLKQRSHDEAARAAEEIVQKRKRQIGEERIEKYKSDTEDKKREQRINMRNIRHQKTRDVREYAITLAEEIRKSDKTSSLYRIAREIAAQVVERVEEIEYKLSKNRLHKTIEDWLSQAKKNGRL